MSTLKQILEKIVGRPVSWDIREKTLWALGTSRSDHVVFEIGEDFLKIRCQVDPVRFVYVPFSAIGAVYMDD